MYKKPIEVISPQASISNVRPIIDNGEENWSMAMVNWEGDDSLAIRWNGCSYGDSNKVHPGLPQSRGLSTWFILPNELKVVLLQYLSSIDKFGGEDINKDEVESFIKKLLNREEVNEIAKKTQDKILKNLIRETFLEMKKNKEI